MSCETTAPPDETQTSTAEKQEYSEPETLPRDINEWKWAVTSIAILSSIFLYSLDDTIVAVIQATIVTEFDSLNDLAWINVGFLMAGTATNMIWGQVYSQFNSKWMYLLNVVLFELDYAGMVLLLGSLVSFIMAINFGGLTYPWNSGQIIALFVIAAMLVALLGVQQRWAVFTTLPHRLIPIQLLGSRTVLILFASTSASAARAFIPIFFVSPFFQFTRNDGVLDAGIRLLPLIIVLVVAIFVNGLLMARFGYYMPWYLVGSLISVGGGALMYPVDRSSSQSAIYGYTVLIGFGIGIFIQASFSVAQAIVDPKNVAAVVGFMTLAQYLGNTTALAIANSLFMNLAETKVEKDVCVRN
ncbi:MFS general substrate transporter [Colletotrichum sp. SAR 10_86]|nr:MFS general substrate transporter [Colletotrichum sp. SAR 10_86]